MDGLRREVLETPSTVGGLAFDRKGGRLPWRITAASRSGRAKTRLEALDPQMAGSHTAVSFSPDDRFVMTRMQENALHGWRLRDRLFCGCRLSDQGEGLGLGRQAALACDHRRG